MALPADFKPAWDMSPVPQPKAAFENSPRPATTGAPRYRLCARTFVKVVGTAGPRLYLAGDEVETLSAPGRSMIPLNEAARAARLATLDQNEYAPSADNIVVRTAQGLGFSPRNGDEARQQVLQWIATETAKAAS